MLVSATLLSASFPNFNQPWCAWVALVPWLLLLRQVRERQAFWWSWLIGFLFFLGSIWWLVHVTVVGWVVLCAYLALYFGAFGWFTCRFTFHVSRFTILLLPAAWVALEYARSHLLSGFGWNLLAYSQTPWLPIIQMADVTGAWGVSFLIVFVNVHLAEAIQARVAGPAVPRLTLFARDPERGRRPSRRAAPPPHVWLRQTKPRGPWLRVTRHPRVVWALGLPLATSLIVLGYGLWGMSHATRARTVRVALVQGNIPQEEKWDEASREHIIARYETLTRGAAQAHPDLIVWPETSTPYYLGLEEAFTQRMFAFVGDVGIPLLTGAPMSDAQGTGEESTNSAALVGPDGSIRQRYDKLHLVPFGEFIPFERAAPWLRAVLPPIGDFVPGRHYTVFATPMRNAEFGMRNFNSAIRNPQSEMKFSVLICFEDIFPELARRFVRNGAQVLFVITNDAWFGPTAAAYQHAQASAFRAVELRVPVARAANTGWSGCIDPAGRWIGSVHDATRAELFVPGTHTCELPVGIQRSFYLRWGDWFALLCVVVTIGWTAFLLLNSFQIRQLR